MTRYSCFLLFASLAISLLQSCAKRETEQTVSTQYFSNGTSNRLTLDVYNNKDDYDNIRNRVSRDTLDPGATRSFQFEVLKTYWIDWYDDRYSINNWRNTAFNLNSDGAHPGPKVIAASEDDAYPMVCDARDSSRAILLHGDGFSSSWSGKIKNKPGVNGTYSFVFKRSFEGELLFTDPDGNAQTTPFKFYVSNIGTIGYAKSFIINLIKADNSLLASISWNRDYWDPNTMYIDKVGTQTTGLHYPIQRQ